MEQKQLKMWLPSFLTWRAERVLQKQAEMGYLLIAVENFGSFYTFSFESIHSPLRVRRHCRGGSMYSDRTISESGAHTEDLRKKSPRRRSAPIVQRSSNAATVTPLWRNYGRMYRMT